ncbi:MAG: sterol desaturase family protein, partial [Myxococcales bacterium]|nr:sterol desaturase family protein [Myxococcales bacterium]
MSVSGPLDSWILANAGTAQEVAFGGALLALLALEAWRPRRRAPARRRQRWPVNFALTALNVVALGFVPVSFVGAALWARAHGVGVLNAVALPPALAALATLLVRGLLSTITHLLHHQVPLLWRIHRVHHLDAELDVSSTVRFHPLEMLTGPLLGLPFVLAGGLEPWALALYELLDVVVTLFSHANLRLPRGLERALRVVVVTPELHRIHHSRWAPETDSNYGAVFPIWDVVLGTYRGEPRDDPATMALGLDDEPGA